MPVLGKPYNLETTISVAYCMYSIQYISPDANIGKSCTVFLIFLVKSIRVAFLAPFSAEYRAVPAH